MSSRGTWWNVGDIFNSELALCRSLCGFGNFCKEHKFHARLRRWRRRVIHFRQKEELWRKLRLFAIVSP